MSTISMFYGIVVMMFSGIINNIIFRIFKSGIRIKKP